MKNQRNKEDTGITLVALVITIVILLILAGISVSTLTNTGLFNKAKEARQKSENAQILENSTLAKYENTIESIDNNTRQASGSLQLDYAKAIDISSYTSEDNKYIIPDNGFLVVQYNEENTTVTHYVQIHINDYPYSPLLSDNEWGIPENFSTIINKGQSIYFTFRYYDTNNRLQAFFIPFK